MYIYGSLYFEAGALRVVLRGRRAAVAFTRKLVIPEINPCMYSYRHMSTCSYYT